MSHLFVVKVFTGSSQNKRPDDGLYQAKTCCLNTFLKNYFGCVFLYNMKYILDLIFVVRNSNLNPYLRFTHLL